MNRLFLTISLLLMAAAFVSAAPKSRWADLGGTKIHYYDIGPRKDQALVFVHCWTCNVEFYRSSYNAFPEYRVIALDLPGHGKSDKPKLAYSMEYFARAVQTVLDKAKVKKAVLIGHSMGTPVTRQYYKLFPDRVKGIVVVDGALVAMGPREQMEMFVAPLRKNYRDASAKMVEGMLTTIKDADLKKTIQDSMLSTPEHVGLSAMEQMLEDNLWKHNTINVPVLAVMAPGFWPPNTKDAYTKVAPDIDFQMWTGVSHFLHMERPAEFNIAVKDFITRKRLL
jgi:pimeloyl-ACP methyl ester carboxylesterase